MLQYLPTKLAEWIGENMQDELGFPDKKVYPSSTTSRGGRPPKRVNYTFGTDDIQVQLVFYSTFEPVDLPGGGPLEAVGVQKLYKPSPTPILDVGLAVLGRVPLMPLFLLGNSTPTIPH